jgi:hypothetical protein
MTDKEVRDELIYHINKIARNYIDEHRKAVEKLENLERERDYCLDSMSRLNMTKDEIRYELLDLYKSSQSDNEREYDKLISWANEFIMDEYSKGKYDGREIRTLFSVLFEKISPELGARFNA